MRLVFLAIATLTSFVCAQTQTKQASKPLVLSGTVNLVAATNGGTIVKFTSQLDEESWSVRNLIDGTVWDGRLPQTGTNGWASKDAKFPQEIVFAFRNREIRLINKVVLDPTIPDPTFIGRATRDFEIWVTTDHDPDKATWKLVLIGTLRNEKRRQEFFFIPSEARFVKLRILSNHGSDRYVALGEFEVYEATHGIAVLDQLIARLEQLLVDLKRYRDLLAEQGLRAVTEGSEKGQTEESENQRSESQN
ncbi:MAG: SUN domain-containing protein [Armatimonadetes bacterium]|nr:SUN domain-containing protein [Armatimonadota bacterium]